MTGGTGAGPRVGDVGELELLRLLQPWLAPSGAGLVLGNGDDAAVWETPRGMSVAATTDTLVEDIHFLRPADEDAGVALGWKLLAVSLSDLAATGARAGPAMISLALPADFLVSMVLAIYRGLSECAVTYGANLAGGNLSATAGPAVLSSSCLGAVPASAAMRRTGVQPAWSLAVTGELGAAAAALEARRMGSMMGRVGSLPGVAEAAIAAWNRRLDRPEPRMAAGIALAEIGVGVAIDVSDGLYQDAARLCRPGLGVVIDAERLPVAEGVREGWPGRWLEIAGGGGDYELLFAGPQATVRMACAHLKGAGCPATVIGAFDSGDGVRLRDSGELAPAPVVGYQHFHA